MWPCAGATAQDGAGETTPFWRARCCRARAGLPFWRSGARRRGVIRACIPKKALRCSWSMRPTVPFRMQPCKRPRRGARALGGGRQRSSLGVWVPGNAAPVRPAAVGARVVFERPERCCSWADRAGRRSSTYGRRALSARRPGQGCRAWGSSDGAGGRSRGRAASRLSPVAAIFQPRCVAGRRRARVEVLFLVAPFLCFQSGSSFAASASGVHEWGS